MTPEEIVSWCLKYLATPGVIIAVLAFVASNIFKALISNKLKEAEKKLDERSRVVIDSFSNQLGLITESHKAKLRKSEYLFEREYSAARAFLALYDNFYPAKAFPLMDWDDALESICDNIGLTEGRLKKFLNQYSPALEKTERAQISRALTLCVDCNFDAGEGNIKSAKENAQELFDLLHKMGETLHDRVRGQSAL